MIRIGLMGLFICGAWAQQNLDLVPHANFTTPPPSLNDKVEDPKKAMTTREREITVNGVRYKQIQYNGQFYTVNAREADNYTDCTQTYMPQDSFAADTSFKLTKHTAIFLETLRQRCSQTDHMVMTSKDMRDGNIGVQFKGDGPNPSTKVILVNPLKQMGSLRTDF